MLPLAHLKRPLYLLAMYSGVRALANRRRHVHLPLPASLAALSGRRVQGEGMSPLELQVHGRRRPPTDLGAHAHGMFSLRMVQPTLPSWQYRYLCATSHFGCGHVEVAFYLEQGAVVFYAIRNLARGNAQRLGWDRAAARLSLSPRQESLRILRLLSALLQVHGIRSRHATAETCLRLAVDPRLLAQHHPARRRLLARYQRLATGMGSL